MIKTLTPLTSSWLVKGSNSAQSKRFNAIKEPAKTGRRKWARLNNGRKEVGLCILFVANSNTETVTHDQGTGLHCIFPPPQALPDEHSLCHSQQGEG